jgi:hypothetical protein
MVILTWIGLYALCAVKLTPSEDEREQAGGRPPATAPPAAGASPWLPPADDRPPVSAGWGSTWGDWPPSDRP